MEALPLENITEADLQAAGLENPAHGLRLLQTLPGQGITDDDIAPLLPRLLNALRQSPDPDRALSSFARWFEAVGNRAAYLQLLMRHPIALDVFARVTGSSQYFADLLARNPEYFEIVANPGVRGGRVSASALTRNVMALVTACHSPQLQRDALRRWKAREMLRIGVRDLVGLADMPITAREFSNLADACVQCALAIAVPQSDSRSTANFALPVSFAIIGMGKLGGQELNYSSDIDLMFVHGDTLPEKIELPDGRRVESLTYLTRLAESVVKILSEETANGHVFRVDMRLRPEGRFGALARSLAGFRAYYENWAENWERQALLKARFIAGDRALGEAFAAVVTPYIYRPLAGSAFVRDILDNKRRIEATCALQGETQTNIKTGYGGIRDIEFIVQKFQLIYGGRLPALRTQNTLSALGRLRHARLLTEAQAAHLAEDYQFLRNLEHRLQLLHGFQTQTLPTQMGERLRLARRIGYADVRQFERDLQTCRDRGHAHLETLFYGDAQNGNPAETDAANAELAALLDAIDTPAAQERLQERLTALGLRDIPAALQALRYPMRGNDFGEMPPDTHTEFKAIAPRLLDLAAHAPDPDAALVGFESLALAVPNRAQLYAACDDSPGMLAKLVLLASAAPPLFRTLTKHLEWLDVILESEAEEETPRDSREAEAALRAEWALRLQKAQTFEKKLDVIALFYQRERLRIGARDVWEESEVSGTMQMLTRLAENTLQFLLEICTEAVAAAQSDPALARSTLARVAIIGLGKLGGAELGYGSDLDVVLVYDAGWQRGNAAAEAERYALVNTLAERLLATSAPLRLRSANLEIDLRLRPWGRQGALVYSLRGAMAYYRDSGETWERQAALKARFVAGHAEVGRRFMRILHAVSFGRGVTPEEDAAIAAMKTRIETERLNPAERDTDLKLGHGGLSDIEWLAQRLQIRGGATHFSLRLPNTVRVLSALVAVGQLDNAEADALTATYLLLTRLRNALWLQSGTSQDALPADIPRRRALARLLGYHDDAQGRTAEENLWQEIHAAMQEARRIFLRRFSP